MADNKQYYYMRLKEDFFNDDAMILLENMPDGYLYSNILMKMYLKSLKSNGRLMFNEYMPYDPNALAVVTHHQVGTVEKALDIFRKLGLIEVLDNGAIYMLNIQNFIGKSTTEADRKREYRNTIESEKKSLNGQMSDISTPEIELKKEKEKDIDLDNTIPKGIVSSTKVQPIMDAWNDLGLQKLISLNPNTNRYKQLHARINQYGIDTVMLGIDCIKHSKFLLGQNKKGWVITFDWFIKPNNFIKVVEGNYADQEGGVNNGQDVGEDANGFTEQALKLGLGKDFEGF